MYNFVCTSFYKSTHTHHTEFIVIVFMYFVLSLFRYQAVSFHTYLENLNLLEAHLVRFFMILTDTRL